MIMADGLDKAVIGVGQQFNQNFIVYSKEKVLKILVEEDGMTYDEAVEYYDYNIVGSWVGLNTPIFVTECSAEEVRESVIVNGEIQGDIE